MLRIIILLSWVNSLQAQIGGIAGTKNSSLSHGVIDHKTVEFEPTFSTSFSSAFWNDRLISSDSTAVESNLMWRIALGIKDKLEVGAAITCR